MASVTWLGHASFEVNLGGSIIYFDPWFDQKPRQMQRLVSPGISNVDSIRKADAIMISHEHFDHCDPYDVTRISQKTFATVVAPDQTLALLTDVSPRQKMAVQTGDEFTLHGLDVSVTPARHPQSINPVGYIVEKNGKSVYFAGDTYDFFEMGQINVDVALIPIGGTYTMDIYGALSAIKRIKARFVVPMHFNTFEKITVDSHDFAKRSQGNGRSDVKVLQIGQTLDF